MATRTAELIRPSAALVLALFLGIVAVACGRDSQGPSAPTAPTGPGGINPPAGRLEILSIPPALLVKESVLVSVKARNADGTEAGLPPEVQWKSSDETVVRVQPGGSAAGEQVLTALRRGTVTITVSAANLAASVSLTVKGRVSILPDVATPCEFPLTVCIAIGERTSFRAVFVDVNGERLSEPAIAGVTWTSSDPDVASVNSPLGISHVTGLRAGRVTISASTSDGEGALDLIVTDVSQGGSARVRFAHADHGRGPLTFVPSRGAPVTLAFGEWADVPIASGTFAVQVDGVAGGSGNWMVRDGDGLEVFATNAGLNAWWANRATVPADSGLIRFVEASAGLAFVVLLGEPAATVAQSRLLECYFDPGAVSQYVPVRSGEFDVLVGGKGLFFSPGLAIEGARRRITVTPGGATTYVFTGTSFDTMRVLSFPKF